MKPQCRSGAFGSWKAKLSLSHNYRVNVDYQAELFLSRAIYSFSLHALVSFHHLLDGIASKDLRTRTGNILGNKF
jgi:hypothetical protein